MKYYYVDIFGNPPKVPAGLEGKMNHVRFWDGNTAEYFHARVPESELRRVTQSIHGKYRVYEERWEKSATYRYDFLKKTKLPCRCAYCGKLLTRKDMIEVDHIISANRLKKEPGTRILLEARGIHNVNDMRNLTASCRECNQKKSDAIGLWPVRAWMGKHNLFFMNHIFRDAAVVGALTSIACVIYETVKK